VGKAIGRLPRYNSRVPQLDCGLFVWGQKYKDSECTENNGIKFAVQNGTVEGECYFAGEEEYVTKVHEKGDCWALMEYTGNTSRREGAVIKALVDSGCTTTLFTVHTEHLLMECSKSVITIGGFEGAKRVRGSKCGKLFMKFILQEGRAGNATYFKTVNTVEGLNRNLFSICEMIHDDKFSMSISGVTGFGRLYRENKNTRAQTNEITMFPDRGSGMWSVLLGVGNGEDVVKKMCLDFKSTDD